MKFLNRARVTAIDEIAPHVFEVEVTMVAPPRFAFSPGQYVSVRIAATNEHRSYSIASAPTRTDGFMLLVRRKTGVGSQFLASLEVGAEIEFDGPRGEFGLVDRPGDAVFGATGVGVSPLFPMIETLLARRTTGRVRLFWGLVTAADQFWRERLAQLAADPRFASRIVLSGEGEGFITQPIIETVSVLDTPTYYICGNGQMVKDVLDGLTSAGIDRERHIRTDFM